MGSTPLLGIPYPEPADPLTVSGPAGDLADLSGQIEAVWPRILNAIASSGLTLSTVSTDVPGATVTFTTTRANTRVLITGVFDFRANAAASAGTFMVGECHVNGAVPSSSQALCDALQTDRRATVTQQWRATLTAAGSHTIKLRAFRTVASGTLACNATHTTLAVCVFGPVV